MTVRAKIDPALTETIRADYATGNFTQGELAVKHNISAPSVNKLVKGIKPEKRKYTHKTSKFTERNAEIRAKAAAGASTRALAAEYNVTHQNISLILKGQGVSPIAAHKERLAVKSAARAEQVAAAKGAKKDAKMAKVNALSALWKSGAKIGELREFSNLKSDNAMQVKIVILRRKYGIEMFPKRPAFGRTSLTSAEGQAEKLVKIQKLSAAWNAGKSVEECANEVGWKPATFSRSLPHLRKEFGEAVFNYRRVPTKKAEAPATTQPEDFVAPTA